MEKQKRDLDQIMKVKTLKQNSYSYNRRKECIKRKTMELATLCDIAVCTIIYEPNGEVESWPKNPTAVKALIKNFKDLTSIAFKKTTIRDESHKKVADLPDREVDYWPEKSRGAKRARIEDKDDNVNLAQMIKKILPASSESSLTKSQKEELLKQLDYKLQALTKRIESLRRDRVYNTDQFSENKQWTGSTKASHTPFSFDLNYLPPDEAECLYSSSENCGPLVPANNSILVHCSHSSGISCTSTSACE